MFIVMLCSCIVTVLVAIRPFRFIKFEVVFLASSHSRPAVCASQNTQRTAASHTLQYHERAT